LVCGCDVFQLIDALPDRKFEQVGVNDSGEVASALLVLRAVDEKVLIAGEQDAAEGSGPVEQDGIGCAGVSVNIRGRQVDAPDPRNATAMADCTW
jgi:hypothetical protein